MSTTGIRGLVQRLFGGRGDAPDETRDSLERATGVKPAETGQARGKVSAEHETPADLTRRS